MQPGEQFLAARDLLLRLMEDLAGANAQFRWPAPEYFNWARDYFDPLAARTDRAALCVADEAGRVTSLSYRELSQRSSRVAAFLQDCGLGAGDRILVMLGNVAPLWECMLAAMKLGAVVIPATTLLQKDELLDRLERGQVRAIITDDACAPRFEGLPGAPLRICVGAAPRGWRGYAEADGAADEPRAVPRTRASDLLLLYFTSGTTARPKLVAHTHLSYPVGHLSTMYWIGLRAGDVHLNLSSPGWAKHAWSCFFAPFNAGATVLAYHYARFDPAKLLDLLVAQRVTTFCAPPTVWRMLIQQDLPRWKVGLRELVSAGEPLNPEVIEQVQRAWGLTIRDGFGQTETTAAVGNPPGQPLVPGAMGRPLPGYDIALLDVEGRPGEEGEVCIALEPRPAGLMTGYLDDAARTAAVMHDGYYHTGDVAARGKDGYLTYVGRMDDVFKSSDYRISPFELESVLIEHPAVAEAAVVPSPDPVRLAVPKAFLVLAAGHEPDAATARSIFAHVQARVAPYKRVRRLEFAALPKTISGKIRRVELRTAEQQRAAGNAKRPQEFWEQDFPDLKAAGGSGA
jgi:acetyl-CoA synthetase